MAGDPYFENVALLLHMDGSNGSTTFTDSSNNNFTVTPSGNAQISTAQSKFGGASGYFDGTGDYLTVADHVDLRFGTGAFTIECWVYLTSTQTQYAGIVNSIGAIANSFAFSFQLDNRLSLYTDVTPNGQFLDGVSSVPNNQWVHVACVRESTAANKTHLFINGVLDVSGTITTDLNTTTGLYVANNRGNGIYLSGYIDDLRITEGVARYTSDFTPPTAAFPNYAGQISGTLSESLSATNFKAHLHNLSGNLLSASTVTAGAYSIDIGTLDPVTLTMYPDIGTKWTASTAYALNDKVFPTDPATTPYYYECTTAGTSGATEPTWPTSTGTVNDGTAVWTFVEPLTQPITHGPLIPS